MANSISSAKAKGAPKSITSKKNGVVAWFRKHMPNLRRARKEYLSRRPHRSFVRTYRRDYVRTMNIPGYVSFTLYVMKTLKEHKSTFLGLVIVSAIATGVLSGMSSQDTFTTLTETLQETGQSLFEGGTGEIQKAGLLVFTAATGGIATQPTEAQQIFAALIALLTWLSTVWLLRAFLAGSTPTLRDALYNAGAPIVSSGLVFFLFMLQLVPAAIAIIGYSAAVSTDFISTGVIGMLVAIVCFLLIVLSVYLVTSTFFALVIITLPGMNPWQALRTSGDLVIGRRFRLLLRLVWLVVSVAITWGIILIPIVLLATWIQTTWQQTAFIPIVPFALLLMTSLSSVFVSSYVYLLYRKVVDDDAKPA